MPYTFHHDPYYQFIFNRSKKLPEIFDSKGKKIWPDDVVYFFFNGKKIKGIVSDMGDFFDRNNPDPRVKVRVSKTRTAKIRPTELFVIPCLGPKFLWQQEGF